MHANDRDTQQYTDTNSRIQRKRLKISCHTCKQKLDVTTLPSFSRINCPSCASELIVPMWFDQYLLEEPGGVGGMATVYRALDPALDREIAIKILKNDTATNHASRMELFLHEARTAATINHHAVIPIFTCGVFDNQAYIVMQYMAGGSLENRLNDARGVLNIRSVARWIRDVAEGLENARNHGIVHHDIKPANIMLDSDGNAKIGDFGIAQAVNVSNGDRIAELTRTWVSPHYVSPEKVLTGQEDFKGDIYSLGATFYHLVTGFTPFSNSDVEELIRMRLDHSPLPPYKHRSEIGTHLSTLILSMMSEHPDDRPDYNSIIAAVNEFLNEGTTYGMTSIPRNGDNDEKQPDSQSIGIGKRLFTILLWFIFTVLLIATAAAAIGYLAWMRGVLPESIKGYFPERKIQNNTNDTSSNSDAAQNGGVISHAENNSDVISFFAAGEPEAAKAEAKSIFENVALSSSERVQAALQYAYAVYLDSTQDVSADDAESPEKTAASLLNIAMRRFTSEELKTFNDDIQILTYLARRETDPAKLKRWDVDTNGPDFKAKLRLAALLMKLRDGADERELRAIITAIDAEFKKIPSSSWLLGAFYETRFPVWRNIIRTNKGSSASTEPLFRKYIALEELSEEENAEREKTASELSGGITENEVPEIKEEPVKAPSNVDEDLVAPEDLPDVSEEVLKTAFSKYTSSQRPQPKSPFMLSGSSVERYFARLPKELMETERKRIDSIQRLKQYIVAMSSRNPYHLNSFRSVAGKRYSEKTFMFRDQDIFYKQDDSAVTMEWSDLPYQTVIDILKYYADYRADAQVGARVKKADKMEQAKAFIRLALLAYWYGDLATTSSALEKALKLAPYKQVCKSVDSLFLN